MDHIYLILHTYCAGRWQVVTIKRNSWLIPSYLEFFGTVLLLNIIPIFVVSNVTRILTSPWFGEKQNPFLLSFGIILFNILSCKRGVGRWRKYYCRDYIFQVPNQNSQFLELLQYSRILRARVCYAMKTSNELLVLMMQTFIVQTYR